MLIIEGPDGVGKTTAAQKLCKYTGWDYKHMSKPGPTFNHFLDYMRLAKEDAVWDRFHLGSLAYGAIISKEGQDQNYERFRAVCRALDFFGVTTIIMYARESWWLRKRLSEDTREQMYDLEKIIAVNDVYRWMAEEASDTESFRGITFGHIAHNVCEGYPNEAQLEYWTEVAKRRIRGVS